MKAINCILITFFVAITPSAFALKLFPSEIGELQIENLTIQSGEVFPGATKGHKTVFLYETVTIQPGGTFNLPTNSVMNVQHLINHGAFKMNGNSSVTAEVVYMPTGSELIGTGSDNYVRYNSIEGEFISGHIQINGMRSHSGIEFIQQ